MKHILRGLFLIFFIAMLFIGYMIVSIAFIGPKTHQKIAEKFVYGLCTEGVGKSDMLRSSSFKEAVTHNEFIDIYYKYPYCNPKPKSIEWITTGVLSSDNTVRTIAKIEQDDQSNHFLGLKLNNSSIMPWRWRVSHAIPGVEDIMNVGTLSFSEYCSRIKEGKLSESNIAMNCD